MRRSMARPIAAHMQRQAVLSRHEGTREASTQRGVCGWAAASLLKLSFPMASMKEHRLAADGYVCATESPQGKRAAAPSVHALMLRPNRRFEPISECRFHPLQIGVDIGHRCRALSVCCLRDLGINPGRYLGWILNPPRRSFKMRVLVDRQRPMKNVTLDRATVLQLHADGTDSALDAAADCHVLRNDAALNVCAIADLEIRGSHFAFNSAKDLSRTIAFDLADDRHVGADAGGHSRFCRRF